MSEPLARGWATVGLERALGELEGALAAGAVFELADRSGALGARCARGRSPAGDGWIVVMEPDTEGPLAGFLARYGEGWAATWLADDSPDASHGLVGASSGPLGPERLEPGSRFGPFRLRVSPATIGR